jgi:hypothetical protein
MEKESEWRDGEVESGNLEKKRERERERDRGRVGKTEGKNRAKENS